MLHQCGKMVKTKSQKYFGANFCVCRSYRGKTGRDVQTTIFQNTDFNVFPKIPVDTAKNRKTETLAKKRKWYCKT